MADPEETPRELDDRVEGEHAPVGERAGVVEGHAAPALGELVTETALARARLAGDQDDVRPAGLGLAQSLREPRDLLLAADEAGEARARDRSKRGLMGP